MLRAIRRSWSQAACERSWRRVWISASFLAVCPTVLLLIHCSATVPEPGPGAVPTDEVVFHGLPCGEPLPEHCGPVGRNYLELPSRIGLSALRMRELEEGATPTHGPMSEPASQAQRLFDLGMWAEAAVALERVAKGEYGDDEGVRQVAEYHMAIAYLRLKQHETAADLFLLMGEAPSHIKGSDSWHRLPDLFSRCPTQRVLLGVRRFDDSGVLYCFTTPGWEKAHRWQRFLRARAFAEAREFDDAWGALNDLLGDPEYGEAADQCLDWIESESPYETR